MVKFKYSNEYIDKNLIGRNIKRLTVSNGSLKPCQWQCLIDGCNYIWANTPSKVIDIKQGCRKCKGLIPISVEKFDEYLNVKNITRLNEFKNIKDVFHLECKIASCKFNWEIKGNYCYNQSGCPKCARVAKLNNDIIDNRLVGRSIKRLSDFKSSQHKLQLQCLVENCNYIWFAKSGNLFQPNDRGCPKCGGSLKLTNQIIDARLQEKCRTIKRIGEYINIHSQIEWECQNNHRWHAAPNEIVNDFGSCPICSYANQHIIYDTLNSLNIDFEYQKDIRSLNNKEQRKCMLDFYIPSLNLSIEYDGEQHYHPVRFNGISQEIADSNFIKQQDRDRYVENFCKDNLITLIRINGMLYKNKKLHLHMCKIIQEYKNGEQQCQKKTH